MCSNFKKYDRQEYKVSERPQTEELFGAVELLMDNVYTRIVDKVIKLMKEKAKTYMSSSGTQLHPFTLGQPCHYVLHKNQLIVFNIGEKSLKISDKNDPSQGRKSLAMPSNA